MAIEDILAALDEQACEECEQVLIEAREHAEAIIADAKREAARVRVQQRDALDKAAQVKASRLLNAARLDGKMLVSQAKGDGVGRVFDAVRGRLSTLRGRPDYDRLFTALAEEALSGVTGDVVIRVADEDIARAGTAAASLGIPAKVEGGLSTAGGLIVEADGGRVVKRNTLEDRLERAIPLLQSEVARTLLA